MSGKARRDDTPRHEEELSTAKQPRVRTLIYELLLTLPPDHRDGDRENFEGLEGREGPVAQDDEVQGAEGAAGRHVDLPGGQGPRRAWAPRGLDHPSRNHQVAQSRKD